MATFYEWVESPGGLSVTQRTTGSQGMLSMGEKVLLSEENPNCLPTNGILNSTF